MRKEFLNEYWTCEGTLGYRPCVRTSGKLRPVSVKRVLRQDLLESLSQRTGDRERLRIFTSLAFQRILAEFQELHPGYKFPGTRFHRAASDSQAATFHPISPSKFWKRPPIASLNQHFSRNPYSALALMSGRSPRWAPVLAPRPVLHISRRIPLKPNRTRTFP